MNYNFLRNRAGVILVAGLMAVVAITAAYFWHQSSAPSAFSSKLASVRAKHKAERKERKERELEAGTPDRYFLQDARATADPALGYPTREELFVEIEARKTLKALRAGKTSGAPSGDIVWTSLGPNNQGGRTRAILWDPNDATGKKVWSGGASGGLWFNNDITSSTSPWQQVDDLFDNLNISCITADPTNPQVMYFGTGESFAGEAPGAGVWKTTNGGTTWNRLPNSAGMIYVNDIAVRNEGGVGVLYVGINNTPYDGAFVNGQFPGALIRGLFRSTDGGANFTQVMPNVPMATSVFAVADIEIGADNRIYVGTARNGQNVGGGHVLFSDDGTTWTINAQFVTGGATPVTGARRVELATAPSDANVVYALIEERNPGSAAGMIARSSDRGATFTPVSEPNDVDNGISASDFTRGQAFYDLILAVDPNEANTVLVGGINLFRSTNGGTNWTHISKWSNNAALNTLSCALVHADQHAIAFKPGSSQEVIFGTDGGVYWTNSLSTAATTNVIRQRSLNQVTTQFYRGDVSAQAPLPYVLAGSQDNGTQLISNTTFGNGEDVFGGDGAYTEFDPINDRQIVSYVYNNYAMYFDAFSDGVNLVQESNTGDFINAADADWQNNYLFSAESNTEIRITTITSVQAETSSVATTVPGMTSFISSLRVSPATSAGTSVVWAGTYGGKLYRLSFDGSLSAEDKSGAGFPAGGVVSSIAFGTTENNILVTFSNYGVNSLYESTNGGTSWVVKEGNLPNIPVRTAEYNPRNPSIVFIGTDLGVYTTSNIAAASPVWTLQNNSFANVKVTELRMSSALNRVYAFTYGRGVFSAPLPLTVSNEGELSSSISDVKVFPSPFTEQIRVELGQASPTTANLSLYTLDGREVRQQRLDAGATAATVSGNGLASGSYLLVLRTRDGQFSQRVVKQ
jgi:hypothetical protein